ncbi:LysE/ArgO family amino acid transporter [Microterricola viridarii]|uniref:L-lysine exporter family protein LysE/ArgO n=1 Tax=Microterricola viridarii TaxID=412690 RepID=A0A1H1LCF7_9MICO|nr:LysE/ArgO family amino acid transporter [Microterricola viridarii]SDR71549.1 L-lysine exporter family protein LysE/ArgO [Microterricola viridarii]
MTPSLAPLLAGIGLGFSLIIAIGAQNVFVLRQGIRREHVLAVVILCAVSDAVLIMVGISGIGALLGQLPWLLPVARWAGALFLVGYGLLAAWRALRPGGAGLLADAAGGEGEAAVAAEGAELAATGGGAGATRSATAIRAARTTTTGTRTSGTKIPGTARAGTLGAALATAFALTWLNPHVYLDTVFLLGSVANGHGDPGRWLFGAGAIVASLVWFTSLGFGARYLGRWLGTPRAWRVLDAVIAVVMVTLGVLLVLPH